MTVYNGINKLSIDESSDENLLVQLKNVFFLINKTIERVEHRDK